MKDDNRKKKKLHPEVIRIIQQLAAENGGKTALAKKIGVCSAALIIRWERNMSVPSMTVVNKLIELSEGRLMLEDFAYDMNEDFDFREGESLESYICRTLLAPKAEALGISAIEYLYSMVAPCLVVILKRGYLTYREIEMFHQALKPGKGYWHRIFRQFPRKNID